MWYQNALEYGQLTSWKTLVRAMLIHFGPIAYNEPMETLTCLKQTIMVATYKAQFEFLSNRLRILLDHHKLNCFLSWLKYEIRLPICMLSPLNLNAALCLAKIEEEYLSIIRKLLKPMREKSIISSTRNSSGS